MEPHTRKHQTKTMKKFKMFLREIRVVPVIIEAETKEEAEAAVKQGDGEYLNEESSHSDLNADEYFDSIFEKEAEELTE